MTVSHFSHCEIKKQELEFLKIMELLRLKDYSIAESIS